MCRNIRPLFNFEPPASHEEIEAAALQFVRKISGFQKPSQVNTDAFNLAVQQITEVSEVLLRKLHTKAPKRNREVEAQKAKERAKKRFN